MLRNLLQPGDGEPTDVRTGARPALAPALASALLALLVLVRELVPDAALVGAATTRSDGRLGPR